MGENLFPAAERIISDIGLVFKRDPKLKEFQIIPVTLNENKSPVHHIEHTLGLESWCVPHVYCYAHNLLMDIKQQKRRREDAERINTILIGALLLNPDVPVFWNMRRELVNLDPQFELQFTAVVLTRKPKSAEVFNYRKWLIKKLLNLHPGDYGLLSSEVHTCQQAAELYPNNYYAWNHRIWCLSQLPADSGSYISFLVNEWITTREWVSTHVSDHSGFQYRQHLLQKFVNLPESGYSLIRKCTTDIEQTSSFALNMFLYPLESEKDSQLTQETKFILNGLASAPCEKIESVPLGMILSEMFLNTDLIVVFPGHEAIWSHRRFIAHIFQELVNSLKKEEGILQRSPRDNNGVSVVKAKRLDNTSDSLIQRFVCLETLLYSRAKASKDRQASCAERHRAWLASIMKLNLNLPQR